MATKYVSSENLAYFYGKIKASIDSKLDANKAYNHPNSGVTAGTYRSVTVNAQGHVTAGTNPTTLAGYGITDAAAKTHTHNYAGSSSAGGSANSAVKLATARTINGVNFDGTGSITVTANPTPNQLTNQKLNDTTTPGFYYGGGENTVTNKPDGVDAFGMIVMKNAAGYTEQILIDTDQKIYIRVYNASTWSNWSTLYTTLNKPSKSDVGLGSVENKSSATIRGELTKANVTTALGYTPATTNTTYSTGTSTYSGTTKLYSGTGSATDGAMTQAATTSALSGKANSSHTHQSGDIVSLDAGKLTGTISIDRLPAGALERCIVVADDTARKALTTAKAQTGDTVKVTATGLMYLIVDDTKLDQDAGYVEYTAGSASRVPWSGVSGKPTTLGGYGITDAAAKNHTHLYAGSATAGGAANSVANSLSIQLNGGAATAYNGSAAKSINITPSGIGAATSGHTHTSLVDSTDSSSTCSMSYMAPDKKYSEYDWIAVWDGKTLKSANKNQFAAASHSHSYAGSASAGGSANSAVKLATARSISLGGDLSGSAAFDGSANITISASVTAMTNDEIDKLFT